MERWNFNTGANIIAISAVFTYERFLGGAHSSFCASARVSRRLIGQIGDGVHNFLPFLPAFSSVARNSKKETSGGMVRIT
jgi:hypothetical protein